MQTLFISGALLDEVIRRSESRKTDQTASLNTLQTRTSRQALSFHEVGTLMNDLLAENLYISLTLMYTFVIMSAITVAGAACEFETNSL